MIYVLLTFTLQNVRQLYHSNAPKRWHMHNLHFFTLQNVRKLYHSNSPKRWYMSYLHSPYRTFDNCIIRTHRKMIHFLLAFTLQNVRQLYHSNAPKRWYMSYLRSVCRTFDNCIIWIYNMQARRYIQAIGTTATTLNTQNKAKVVQWDKLNTMTMKLSTHNKEQLGKNALSQITRVRWVLSPILTRCTRYNITWKSDLRQVGGFLRVLLFPPPIKLTVTI